MSNEDRDPQKKRSSKLAPSLGGLAKSGVSLATDSVATVVKGAKASGSFVQGTAKTITKASGKAVQGTAKTLNPTNLFKKSKQKSHKDNLYEDLGTDAAEEYLLEALEARGRSTIPNGDGFRPAVEGERPPLGLDTLGNAFDEEAPAPKPNYRNMARMAHQQSQRKLMGSNSTDENNDVPTSIQMNNHQRVQSLLESINDNGEEEEDENEIQPDDAFAPIEDPSAIIVDESRPLLGGDPVDRYNSTPYERVQEARRNKAKQHCRRILSCLNPLNIIKSTLRLLLLPFSIWALPLFVIGCILFYQLGNPELDFLPGEATVSWWLVFFCRQIFLLQVSYVLQTILIDWIILSSRIVLGAVGPWATILCLQSRGWPFLVSCWGVLAMCFLHGDGAFVQHWLHFTGIKIFTVANSGSYILASDTYLRVLIGMLLAGIATSLKRTIVTLYFGKRSFDTYKTKLEKILNNVILVSEVAELAAAADTLPDPDGNVSDSTPPAGRRSGHVRWSSLKFEDRKKLRNAPQNVVQENLSDDSDGSDSDSDSDDSDKSDKDDDKNDTGKSKPRSILDRKEQNQFHKSFSSLSLDTSTKHFKIKNQLGRWDDPLNKMDKQSHSSVSDILKFRRALTYMDLQHPFTESFGPASSRDELLTSAQVLYLRLLRLSADGSTILPHSVLGVLADNGDGTIDKQKRKALRKIFPPDGSGNVSLLSFVMGCDTVYKKLRYFRASVGNSSVIDNVLERIVDTLFFFVLIILILSLLNLNPWPLLVSISTLMVTFAFAVGPSCAKAIEGIILVIGRRPFDIGDRIVISDSPGGAVPGAALSWFVEDITLFTTTLRFGGSNEVATVSNGSIAQARITNCARSKKAIVHLLFRLKIDFHEGDRLRDFRECLDSYVLRNPNRWDSIVFFRCDEIDTDNEFVLYHLAIRSAQSWQPAPRVLEHRSQLNRFCQDLALEMDISYNAPIPSRVLYEGGKMTDITHPKVNRVREKEGSFVIDTSQGAMPAQSGGSTDLDESGDEFERPLLERVGGGD